MEIQTILFIATSIISSASVILYSFKDLTKKTWDNKLYAFLVKVLKIISLHVPEDKKLEVAIKSE